MKRLLAVFALLASGAAFGQSSETISTVNSISNVTTTSTSDNTNTNYNNNTSTSTNTNVNTNNNNMSGEVTYNNNNNTTSTSSLTRFYHWIRVNGIDVPNSTVRGSIAQNGGDAGIASNHIVSLNAGDDVQVMWAVQRTQVSLVGGPATAFAPSFPAAIVNIFQVNL